MTHSALLDCTAAGVIATVVDAVSESENEIVCDNGNHAHGGTFSAHLFLAAVLLSVKVAVPTVVDLSPDVVTIVVMEVPPER